MVGFEDIIKGLGNQLAAFTASAPISKGFNPGGSGGSGFQVAPVQSPRWQVGGTGQQPGFSPGPVGGNGFQVGGAGGTGFAVGGVNAGGFNVGHYSPPVAPVSSSPPGTSAGSATYTGLPGDVQKWADQTQATFGDLGSWVPAAMLAIIQHESGGSPSAYNSAGDAYGLFQQLHINTSDPNVEFEKARALAQEKLDSIDESYRRNGITPDERTRARDLFLAWAGHFDYATGQPNAASRDIGNGQDYSKFLSEIMPMYDNIVAGRKQGTPTGGGNGDLAAIKAPWAQKAQTVLGVAYTNGGIRQTGDPRSGMDCSSFTGWALGLPSNLWNAQAQYDASKRIDAAQAQSGDLVFFQGTATGDPTARPVTHVGIYIGGGKMIHTGGDGGVMVVDLNSAYWTQHMYGFGRL